MKKVVLLICFTLCVCMGTIKAQYTDIFNFNGLDGQNPFASLTSAGGKLFGITQAGFGQIFSIDTNGGGQKTLFGFNITDGYGPAGAPLTFSGGVLFGTMVGGGTHDSGVVFSIDTNGNNFKDIVNFNGVIGSAPEAAVTFASGKLYGTALQGGAHHYGNIISLDTNGNNFKDIHDFNGLNGAYPSSTLTLVKGKLYGMASGGGAHDSGCIFSIDTNGLNYTDLFDFSGPDGSGPGGAFTYSSGVLFGVASGGTHHYGVVFSIDTDGTHFKDIYDLNSPNGEYPNNSVVLIRNKLFGEAVYGGINQDGTIFSVDTNGSAYRDLLDFNNTGNPEGANPYGGLTLSGNKLYGMTNIGGTNGGYGVIFSFDTNRIATSVNNLAEKISSVNVYPNPGSGAFTLRVESEKLKGESGIIEVYNMLGEKIYSKFLISNSQFLIDLSSSPNGVYLYRVISEDGNLLGEGKVIIQK